MLLQMCFCVLGLNGTMKNAWCVWFVFLPNVFSFDISAMIIKTYIFICCIKQNYKTVESSVKQWQKQCMLLRSWRVNGATWLCGHRVAVWCYVQTGSDWNQCSHTFLLHKGGDLRGLWPGKSPYINTPASAMWKHYTLYRAVLKCWWKMASWAVLWEMCLLRKPLHVSSS